MGPGCGTAMLGGVGLGFANVVRRAAASASSPRPAPARRRRRACSTPRASACRRSSASAGATCPREVGGIMFRAGMRHARRRRRTPRRCCSSPSRRPARSCRRSRRDVPRQARGRRVRRLGGRRRAVRGPRHARGRARSPPRARSPRPTTELQRAVDGARERSAGRRLLGLYSGGSLAHEAVTILARSLGVAGRRPAAPRATPSSTSARRSTPRAARTRWSTSTCALELLAEAARDDDVGCVLLDVVLGHGSHPDPAGALAPALERGRARGGS